MVEGCTILQQLNPSHHFVDHLQRPVPRGLGKACATSKAKRFQMLPPRQERVERQGHGTFGPGQARAHCLQPAGELARIDPVDQTEPPIGKLAQPAEALRPDRLA